MTIEELITKLGIAEDKKASASTDVRAFLDGAYVPKSRLNEVIAEKNDLKTQLSDRDKQLDSLKKTTGDADALKKQIADLQAANKQVQTEYDNKLKALKLDTAIKLAIGDKAQDADIVTGLIDKDKLILGEDGKITGLTEQVEALKKEKAFLFKQADQAGDYRPQGGNPPVKNPFAKDSFNLTEQGKMYKDNPEQAKAMASAAGVEI